MGKECIYPPDGPAPGGPYTPAVKANGFIFVSGQVPTGPNGIVYGTLEEQTKLVLENLKKVLGHAGASLNDIVKNTVFLSDMDDFAEFNGYYKAYFPENPPARSCVQVGRLPFDVRVEIEAIAIDPK